MGLFNSILEKLGLDGVSNEEQRKADVGVIDASKTSTRIVVDSEETNAANHATAGQNQTEAATSVHNSTDISARLDTMAESHTDSLNWRSSIVDLLKVLNLDSSFESRKEMATELGCPADTLENSEQMNVWLHRAVMQKLAEHHGAVPPELRT
ncbi:DUF3597 domain-containing protein [Pseudomonas asuensis]|jgi:hypothetical protein|uniref:DUF3597 domain-containing protein n=1 Tax=Pseudomonas asuensis TaxID=1825787 RepID=A0ABQ2GY88_9PSED|nr:DUF3597 domain-containing protein [Pseudomonas asuensis]GGM16881.1 hypothetical protein GCM10009425_29870 [Pseudomonas asuensis]